jgi:hypothetical protein
MFTKEMQAALQADAEKLEHLTGQKHTVTFSQCFDAALAELREPEKITLGDLISRVQCPGPITLSDRERAALLHILMDTSWSKFEEGYR